MSGINIITASFWASIYGVIPEQGVNQPIFFGENLTILGKELEANQSVIRIGGVKVIPNKITPNQMRISLNNASLRAGEHDLQVLSENGSEKFALGSNKIPIILRPKIVGTIKQVPKSRSVYQGLISMTLEINLRPSVGKNQVVKLLLNTFNTDSPSYLFVASARPRDTGRIYIPIRQVKTGSYLVRVQVDQAETQLEKTGEQYTAPQITIK